MGGWYLRCISSTASGTALGGASHELSPRLSENSTPADTDRFFAAHRPALAAVLYASQAELLTALAREALACPGDCTAMFRGEAVRLNIHLWFWVV